MIGRGHMGRLAIGVRVDSNALDAQLAACANDSQRDLAAIGNQQPPNHSRDPPRFTLFEKRAQAFLSFRRHPLRGDGRRR